MPSFRSLKASLRNWFGQEQWSKECPVPPDCATVEPLTLIQPLFACLTEGGNTTSRAAFVLGGAVARLYQKSPEDAKNIVRRFIWHMNEESGNIGWGIPEAFGETLAQCPALADTYRRILLHYVYDAPEGESTLFCDFAPLRRSCYDAIGRLLEARPDFASEFLPVLRFTAERENDEECKEKARSLALAHLLAPMPEASR